MKILKEQFDYYTMRVNDVLEGFIDNMPEEQIDAQLVIFKRIARQLGVKNIDDIIELRADDEFKWQLEDASLQIGEKSDKYSELQYYVLDGVKWVKEHILSTGMEFYYFADEEDADKVAEICKQRYEIENA